MINFIKLTFLVIVFLLLSCAPAMERATMPPKVDDAIMEQLRTNPSVLILPVWRKVPFFYDGLKPDTHFISTPIFTSGKKTDETYKKLPKPLNYGFVGPACQMGSERIFAGIYIITDSGRIMWLQNNAMPSDPGWSVVKTSVFGADWKTLFKGEIEKNTLIEYQTNTDSNLWGASEGGRFPLKESLYFELSEQERARIIKFLIKIPASENTASVWAKINRSK